MKRIVKLDPRVVYYGDWLLLDIIGRAAYRLYKRRFEKK